MEGENGNSRRMMKYIIVGGVVLVLGILLMVAL